MLDEKGVNETLTKLLSQEKELQDKRAKLVEEVNKINQTLLALQGSIAMAKLVLEKES